MDADFALLKRLLKHQDPRDPKGVTDLAEAMEVSAPQLSRRLSDLASRGLVEQVEHKTDRGRLVVYRPSSAASIDWVSRHRGVAWSWDCNAEVAWEFPLVSQAPDSRARSTLERYLRELRREGLLDLEMNDADGGSGQIHGPLIVAYGSTARGDARPDADVDLLLFLSDAERERYAVRFDDIAGEVSVETPRPIQLDVAPMENPHHAPAQIWDALRREGLIVYDGRRHDHDLWKEIYGGRDDG